MFRDELRRKIMIKFCGPRAKTYSFLSDYYKDSIFNDKKILRTQQRFKSYLHTAYTGSINTIAINSNDDKRPQTYNKITKYPYGTNEFKVCEREMLSLLLVSLKK